MSPIKLSICIPTFNRAKLLTNCLQSIFLNHDRADLNIQICISDNGSTDETEQVVRRAQDNINIDYRKNEYNLGIPQNFLQVVAMASGDFIWLIGDDDLLMPTALKTVIELIKNNSAVDSEFIVSFKIFSFVSYFLSINDFLKN